MTPALRSCCDSILAYVAAHPGCSTQSLTEEIVGATHPRPMVMHALQVLRTEGHLVSKNQRNHVGTPLDAPTFDAAAHLAVHGEIGREIARLAKRHRFDLVFLLKGRGPNAGRQRGVVISQLPGRIEDIAAALRISVSTVITYRGTRRDAA